MDSLIENHKEFIKINKITINTQQRFRSEKYFLTEEINKIVISSNDDKRIQSTDLTETCAYGTGKDSVVKKEEINFNNIMK